MSLFKRIKQIFAPLREPGAPPCAAPTLSSAQFDPRSVAEVQSRAISWRPSVFSIRNREMEGRLQAAQIRVRELEGQLSAAQTHNRELSEQLDRFRARAALPIPGLPDISEAERSPVVVKLLELVHRLRERVQLQRDEIAQLKGLKARPQLRPSRLPKDDPPKTESDGAQKEGEGDGKRPRRKRSGPRAPVVIHETRQIAPENIPPGSRFKGCEDFIVQGIIIQPHNIRYRLERWVTPQGETLMGQLPVAVKGEHFSPEVRGLTLYLHHHARVTQPLIREMLGEFGIDISSGQVSRLLTEGHEPFHQEKEDVLAAGLSISRYVHVDDTGARHQGKNGYCTHIGNELFAYFKSTQSKSRINFLELLRQTHTDYVLNEAAFEYMNRQGLAAAVQEKLMAVGQRVSADQKAWQELLAEQQISKPRHVRVATEGALVGSLKAHGYNPELGIISDGAPQFALFRHGGCWIHAYRPLDKLIGFDDAQKAALEEVKGQIWEFYRELKAYKVAPEPRRKKELRAWFDELFGQKTCFETLNELLYRIRKKKEVLLLVLEYPFLPLENNLSESDVREYVTRRKISGSTRSEKGRECRDTFTSLKKTCRKLGVSFWDYLQDRIGKRHTISRLDEAIRQRGHGQECVADSQDRAAA